MWVGFHLLMRTDLSFEAKTMILQNEDKCLTRKEKVTHSPPLPKPIIGSLTLFYNDNLLYKLQIHKELMLRSSSPVSHLQGVLFA